MDSEITKKVGKQYVFLQKTAKNFFFVPSISQTKKNEIQKCKAAS
jgi:hypothetical protein